MPDLISVLPDTGFVRQLQLVGNRRRGQCGVLPFSATTLWRMIHLGQFPAPVKLTPRVTAWRAEDIHRWISEQHTRL